MATPRPPGGCSSGRLGAAKRGGEWQRITITGVTTPAAGEEVDLLTLDEALTALARLNERQARIIEYFGGLTIPEVADALGIGRRTVDDDWRMARAWLSARLDAEP